VNEQQLGHPHVRAERNLSQITLSILAVLAVTVAGVLLARALLSPGWTRVVSIVGLGSLVLILLGSPRAGLLVWVVLAPFGTYLYLQLDLGSGVPNLDVTRVSALLLLVLLISGAVLKTNGQFPHVTWVDLAMVAFAGAALLSITSSHLGLASGMQVVADLVIIPFLTYYFARRWLNSRNALIALSAAIALVGGLLGLITIREQLTGYAAFSPFFYSLEYEGRIRKVLSVFGSPPIMAITLVVSLPLLMYGIQRVSTLNRRLLLGLALVIVLAGVFFTYVRAGWLGGLVGVTLVIALSPAMRRALLPLLPVVIVAVLLLLTFAVVSPQIVQGRLTSEQPISYRLTAWRIAWDIFRQSPLLGIGYDNFGQAAESQFGWDPHRQALLTLLPATHNSFLYLLVSGGLLALIPYLGIFAALGFRGLSYWRILPQHRELIAILWAMMISYLVMSGTFDAVNAQFASLLLFMITGAILGYLEREVASPELASGQNPLTIAGKTSP
jgi:hypothetical protein